MLWRKNTQRRGSEIGTRVVVYTEKPRKTLAEETLWRARGGRRGKREQGEEGGAARAEEQQSPGRRQEAGACLLGSQTSKKATVLE